MVREIDCVAAAPHFHLGAAVSGSVLGVLYVSSCLLVTTVTRAEQRTENVLQARLPTQLKAHLRLFDSVVDVCSML